MTEQENANRVKQGYADFMKGDIAAVLEIFGEDIVFDIPGPSEVPMAGERRGLQGMREFFAILDRELQFTEFTPREFIAQGDRVVAVGNYTANVKRTGKSFRSEWVMVWRMRNGKAVEFREYNDTLGWAQAFNVVPRAAGA